MKSAREMFEELGYTCEKSIGEITYVCHNCRVCFYLSLEKYSATETFHGLFTDAALNKAIQKQLEELGWLE